MKVSASVTVHTEPCTSCTPARTTPSPSSVVWGTMAYLDMSTAAVIREGGRACRHILLGTLRRTMAGISVPFKWPARSGSLKAGF